MSEPDVRAAWTAAHESSDIEVVRFSANDRTIAVGCFNGNIYIRSVVDSRLMYRIQAVVRSSPITSLRWHPSVPNCVLAASASGFVTCWHTESGQNLWLLEEPGNALNAIDCSPSGLHFATVGSDCAVRYYSLVGRQRLLELASKVYTQGRVTGHSSRVFSCQFVDDNVIASSGWDDTVLIWDTRGAQLVRSVFGTHICGEALCFLNRGRQMITGSWRDKQQLQLWDVGTGKVIRSVTIADPDGENALQIYSLSISKDEQHIAAGGSGRNCVMFFGTKALEEQAATEVYDCCVSSVHIGEMRYAYGLMNSQIYVAAGLPW
jgi:WD40 repeat protein